MTAEDFSRMFDEIYPSKDVPMKDVICKFHNKNYTACIEYIENGKHRVAEIISENANNTGYTVKA